LGPDNRETVAYLESHQGSNCHRIQPVERLLAVSNADATIDIWNTNTGEERSLESAIRPDFYYPEIIDMGLRIAFSPDGHLLATGNRDHTVRLWDVDTGAQLKVLEGQMDAVSSVAFSPNGTLLASGGWDGTIRLWGIPERTRNSF
jgi:WD40 repeat protein